MSEQLIIGDVRPRIQYVADGEQTAFTYPFPIFEAADLEVYLGEDKQEAGFAVGGAGQSSGGTVVFDAPPGDGVLVTLRRFLAIRRLTDFQEAGEFRASVLNDELDRLTAALQQLQTDVQRSLRLADTDLPATTQLPAKAERAGKVATFDADGNVAAAAFADIPADVSLASETPAPPTTEGAAGNATDRVSPADHAHPLPAVGPGLTRTGDALALDYAAVLAPGGTLLAVTCFGYATSYSGTFASDHAADAHRLVLAGAPAHPLAVDATPWRLTTTGVLPSPLQPDTDYYIAVRTSATEIGLSTAPFGAPIALTDDGSGSHAMAPSGTWTKNAATKVVRVRVQAGGGGGGGAPSTAAGQASCGSGGAAGGYGERVFAAAEVGSTETVTVGAGGAPGTAAAADGGAGGLSSFGSHVTATGGGGGIRSAANSDVQSAAGQGGGTCSGGDINMTGNGSQSGFSFGAGLGGNSLAIGGSGGAGVLGGAGKGTAGTSDGFGANPGGSGGSGAAATASASGQTGGQGGMGIVIVEEFG